MTHRGGVSMTIGQLCMRSVLWLFSKCCCAGHLCTEGGSAIWGTFFMFCAAAIPVFIQIVHLCPLHDNKSQWRRQQQEPQQHPDLSFRYPCVEFRHQTYRYRHRASDLTTSIAMFRTRESWFEVNICCRCAANHSENNYKCDYATASTTCVETL